MHGKYWGAVKFSLPEMKLCAFQQRFARAGLLGTVAESLDDETLLTVICNFASFCESISMVVVKRVLYELFGSQWRKYYEAYRVYCFRHGFRTRKTRQRGEYKSDEHPWGAGYSLVIPLNPTHINGYATRIALETLDSIAANCQNFDCSFIPGEPRNCGVDRVWFAENGRLLWVKYHPWVVQPHYRSDDTNRAGSYIDGDSHKNLRLDGQVVANPTDDNMDDWANRGPLNQVFTHFGHEIWDLAGPSQPRCLWSSFPWVPSTYLNQDKDLTRAISLTDVDPVKLSAREYCGALVARLFEPKLTNAFGVHHCVYDTMPAPYRPETIMRPVRFIQVPVPPRVVDMIHFEMLRFHGQPLLTRAQLSDDLTVLGALVFDLPVSEEQILITEFCAKTPKKCPDQRRFTLALWTTCLPRAQLLWEDGIERLCTHCDWVIEKGWLIVHCRFDGTFAYSLESSVPKPIDITPLVGANHLPVLKICGLRKNILVCDGLSSQKIAIVEFTKQGASDEWTAAPIYLSTRLSKFPFKQLLCLKFLTPNYIQNVGDRYVTTTTGHVFDLDSIKTTHHVQLSHTCTTKTLRPMNYADTLKVLALHEFVRGNSAITIEYLDDHPSPCLKLRLINSQTTRHLSCYDATTVSVAEVQLVKFSPSGHAVFVVPHDPIKGGWIITFTSRSRAMETMHMTESYDFRILMVHSRGMPVDNTKLYIRHPHFLSSDIVAVVHRYVEKRDRYLRDREWFYFNDRQIEVVRFSETCAETDADCLGSCINGQDDESLHGLPPDIRDRTRRVYKRWIDILQECPRDQEYRRSINWTGKRVTLSPGRRFLLYAVDRVPSIDALPHVEMRDLTWAGATNRTCLRRSLKSLYYTWLLREGRVAADEAVRIRIQRDTESRLESTKYVSAFPHKRARVS